MHGTRTTGMPPTAMAARAGGIAAPLEIEWQFDADDLDVVARWLRESSCTAPGVTARDRGAKRQRDTYLDTPDWQLYRAGYALRLRETPDAMEATLKSREEAADGPRRRIEHNEMVLGSGVTALQHAWGPVGSRLRALGVRDEVIPLFEVRTWRRKFDLLDAGGARLGEVALDETGFTTDRELTEALHRVEVEAADPSQLDELEQWVACLAAACSLRRAQRSKFDVGLVAAGLQPPAEPARSAIEDASIGALVTSGMRLHFERLRRLQPAARLGDDPTATDRMFEQFARLCSALRDLGDAVPPRFRALQPEFEWLSTQLEVASVADGREGRSRLREVLESDRHADLMERADAELRTPSTGPPVRSADTAAPELIGRRWRRVRRAARTIGALDAGRSSRRHPPERYAELRAEATELRFTLDILEPLYGTLAAELSEALERTEMGLVGFEQATAPVRPDGELLSLLQEVQLRWRTLRRVVWDRLD